MNLRDVKDFVGAINRLADSITPSDNLRYKDPYGSGSVKSLTEAMIGISVAIHRQTETQDGLHRIADALNNVADAIRESKRS